MAARFFKRSDPAPEEGDLIEVGKDCIGYVDTGPYGKDVAFEFDKGMQFVFLSCFPQSATWFVCLSTHGHVEIHRKDFLKTEETE